MADMIACHACSGFVPLASRTCPNCGTRAGTRRARRLARGAAGTLASALFSVLLMACYGPPEPPPQPPCPDGFDADGDGYPAPDDATFDCYRTDTQDCNDKDPTIHPGADDPFGDGIDQNCDGHDGLECPKHDDDGDGYYVWDAGPTCWVGDDPDCDDNDPTIHPYARDEPGDGIDQDCAHGDAVECRKHDRDGDGWYVYDHGDPPRCVIPPSAIEDCDDTNPFIHPHAHGQNNNCGY